MDLGFILSSRAHFSTSAFSPIESAPIQSTYPLPNGLTFAYTPKIISPSPNSEKLELKLKL